MEKKDVKILAIVGMCGSGKSTAIDYLTERKIPKIYFGGVILKGMEEAGIEDTPENEKKFREEIREKEGKDFVVNRVVKEAKNLIEAGQKRIVLDGLYSWTEYKILRQEFPTEMTVVAITEKGGPIAIADYYVDNSADIKTFHDNFAELCKKIGFLDA